MSLTRREFLSLSAAGVLASTPSVRASPTSKIKAVAFDAFTILDPRSVSTLAEELFPGKGLELSNAWRTRQFEYQWLRALSGNYADFWQVTEDSLRFTAESLKLDLTPHKQRFLVGAFLELKAWSDAPLALKSLKDAGIRLAYLSNLTPKILDSSIKNSGLEGIFEQILSTDKIKTYKPDRRAYQMGIDAFRLKKDEIIFAASSGWDAAGAKSFGYATFWVNRQNVPAERLGTFADAAGKNLDDLVNFVKAK